MCLSWLSPRNSVSLLLENCLELRLKKNKIWCHQVEILCIADKSWQRDSALISLDSVALYISHCTGNFFFSQLLILFSILKLSMYPTYWHVLGRQKSCGFLWIHAWLLLCNYHSFLILFPTVRIPLHFQVSLGKPFLGSITWRREPHSRMPPCSSPRRISAFLLSPGSNLLLYWVWHTVEVGGWCFPLPQLPAHWLLIQSPRFMLGRSCTR